MNAKVDQYIAKHERWQAELIKLRKILNDSGLSEEVKWGGPCYTLNGKNVVGVAAFKNHMALWFHQGVFLQDKDKVLTNAQEGKTRAMRQWRFQVGDKIPVTRVRAYVKEAMQMESEGKRIKPKLQALKIPAELKAALDKQKKLANAFAELKPGLQKEYANYISDAKRAETKEKRLTKIKPMILDGIGLNDQYR